MSASTAPWYGRTPVPLSGGFGCKTQVLTAAPGLARALHLDGRQAADITQATPRMQDISTGALLADKGYYGNVLLDWAGAA
ncbi:hypothetical protein [Polaromonas sp. CG9_12]|uniref:hypothetical protein n=1 Tax=Polaromonas sp. CG_9.11 TaxID=2787730 RepID=UPI0004DDCADF|nr:hypothetical protein [Polaromonas sp. CG_9.11]MBG6078071.1 transposase [Polaromonas sp. CG_9.11]CDS52859.1 hypothetical protein [Polaromonas sp. CG9_12]